MAWPNLSSKVFRRYFPQLSCFFHELLSTLALFSLLLPAFTIPFKKNFPNRTSVIFKRMNRIQSIQETGHEWGIPLCTLQTGQKISLKTIENFRNFGCLFNCYCITVPVCHLLEALCILLSVRSFRFHWTLFDMTLGFHIICKAQKSQKEKGSPLEQIKSSFFSLFLLCEAE